MNEIVNCDCIEYMKNISSESVDLIVNDPPYLINYKSHHYKNRENRFYNNEIANDDNFNLIHTYIYESYRILKQNTAMYIFCNCDNVEYFKQTLEKVGFNIKNMIIWVKNNWSAGDLQAQYGKQYEIIFYVNKGRKNINGKRLTDVWFFDRVVGNNQVHQNQKPLDLIKQCIEKSSDENDVVFDGFMGSGTTAVACKETNRQYIGCELDKINYDLCLQRLGQSMKSFDIKHNKYENNLFDL